MAQHPEKPNICFITTSGQITQLKDRYGDPREVSPALTDIAAVDVIRLDQPQPEGVDLTKKVAEAIYAHHVDYDGFVVTADKHDLQIIAPRLAFAFGPNLDKTVAVTSSNIPAAFVHSGASEALVRAAMVAATPFKEVVIAFESSIVRGTSFTVGLKGSLNLLSYDAYQQYGHLGEITSYGVEVNHRRRPGSGTVNFYPDLEAVASVAINPGTEPQLVESIIANSPGTILSVEGTSLPSIEPYSFIPLVDKFISRGIPIAVVNRTIDNSMGHIPNAGEEIIESLGAMMIKHMNLMVASTKFAWVLKRVAEEIAAGKVTEDNKIARVKEWMKTPYVGEFGFNRPFNAIQV